MYLKEQTKNMAALGDKKGSTWCLLDINRVNWVADFYVFYLIFMYGGNRVHGRVNCAAVELGPDRSTLIYILYQKGK